MQKNIVSKPLPKAGTATNKSNNKPTPYVSLLSPAYIPLYEISCTFIALNFKLNLKGANLQAVETKETKSIDGECLIIIWIYDDLVAE